MSLPKEMISELQGCIDEFTADNSVENSETIEISVSIGFTGDITGSLSLGFDFPFLEGCHPMKGQMKLGEQDLVDWSCEVGNQILGRFKNQILQYGASFMLATPTVVLGSKLSLPRMTGYDSYSDWLGENSKVMVNLTAKFNSEIDFSTKQDVETVAEGDSMLF